MSNKEQHHGKDAKKKPQMSLKEKREAKRQKAELKNGSAMKKRSIHCGSQEPESSQSIMGWLFCLRQ